MKTLTEADCGFLRRYYQDGGVAEPVPGDSGLWRYGIANDWEDVIPHKDLLPGQEWNEILWHPDIVDQETAVKTARNIKKKKRGE